MTDDESAERRALADRLAAQCESPAEAIKAISRSGLGKIDTIRAIVQRFGLDVGEAKFFVDTSDSWSEVRARDEEFHDRLEELL